MWTAENLARILAEEFNRDGWGDIDPSLLDMVAEGIDAEDDNAEDAEALRKVLDRVVGRLTKEMC